MRLVRNDADGDSSHDRDSILLLRDGHRERLSRQRDKNLFMRDRHLDSHVTPP